MPQAISEQESSFLEKEHLRTWTHGEWSVEVFYSDKVDSILGIIVGNDKEYGFIDGVERINQFRFELENSEIPQLVQDETIRLAEEVRRKVLATR